MVILTRHFILGSHCSIAHTEGAGPREEGQFPEIGGSPGFFFRYRVKAVKTRKKKRFLTFPPNGLSLLSLSLVAFSTLWSTSMLVDHIVESGLK